MDARLDLPRATAQQRLDIATMLEPLDSATRATLMAQAVVTHGGTFIPADDASAWGPLHPEVSLLGICHSGNDVHECIANWIKAVMRTAMADEDSLRGPAT